MACSVMAETKAVNTGVHRRAEGVGGDIRQ